MTFPLRTWVEIDQNAFAHNIEQYKKIVGPHVMIALVVKSNAYGHGLLEISQLAQNNEHIHMICPAMLSEALLLRARGISKPIFVLSIIDEDPKLAIQHDIDLLVADKIMLDELNKAACTVGKQCNVHIKVDTGLSRLGMHVDEVIPFIRYAQTLPYISIKGISSHFAEASNQDQTFTNQQYALFMSLLKKLQQLNIHIPYRHVTNSAASTTYDLSLLNIIRIGAGAYGFSPSQPHYDRTIVKHPFYNPEPVLSWHTRIVYVRKIPADTFVGYDRTYKTTRETVMALLPVGYGDGYDKRLSNKAVVYLPHCKRFVPIMGRVAMNMITIDVTDIDDVQLGHEVILIGKDPQITAQTIAEITECKNPREITLHIIQTIERFVTGSSICEATGNTKIPYTNTVSKTDSTSV